MFIIINFSNRRFIYVINFVYYTINIFFIGQQFTNTDTLLFVETFLSFKEKRFSDVWPVSFYSIKHVGEGAGGFYKLFKKNLLVTAFQGSIHNNTQSTKGVNIQSTIQIVIFAEVLHEIFDLSFKLIFNGSV